MDKGRGGKVRNVYNATWDVSGSSSGCAVAVSANLATACIGTETFGSIVSPSAANGIIGIKPTIKLVNQKGIIPISSDLDTAGPMCRSTADCDLILRVMAPPNAFDRLDFDQLKIGYFSTPYDQKYAELLTVLGQGNATLVDMNQVLNLNDNHNPGPDVRAFMNCRFRDDLQSYLSTLKNTTMRTLDDIMQFNLNHASTERMSEFGQGVFEQAATAQTYKTNPKFCRDLRTKFLDHGRIRSSMIKKHGQRNPQWGLDSMLAKANVDVIMGLGKGSSGAVTTLAGYALYPVISIPLGLGEHGAWAVGATAKAGKEGNLFALCEYVMRNFDTRVKPAEAP